MISFLIILPSKSVQAFLVDDKFSRFVALATFMDTRGRGFILKIVISSIILIT